MKDALFGFLAGAAVLCAGAVTHLVFGDMTVGDVIGYAPVPRTRLTAEEMTGRWTWRMADGATWFVWLEADGSYRAASDPGADGCAYHGRWWLSGETVVITEWAVGRQDDRATHRRYEVPRAKLADRRPLGGEK